MIVKKVNKISGLINGTFIQISDSDCYMLVSSVGLKDEATFLITKSISAKLTTMRTTTDESLSS